MNRILQAIFGITLAACFGVSAAAAAPSNVGLVRFEAFSVSSGVRLEWDVETELGTAGYKIKRGEGGVFEYLPDPNEDGELFILAEGGPTFSYSYDALDESAVFGTSYSYQLIEITSGSSEQVVETVSIVYLIEPTNTPITFSGGGQPGGNNQAGDATAVPTSPPTATAVPAATVTDPPPPSRVAPTPLPPATATIAAVTPTAESPVNPPPATSNPDAAYPSDDSSFDFEENIVRDSLPAAAVAVALELDEEAAGNAYPAPDIQQVDALAQEQVAAANPIAANPAASVDTVQTVLQIDSGAPVVIGMPGDSIAAPAGLQVIQELPESQEPESPGSSRLLLWFAFIVALIIFSASLVGAILLYSRRRPMK